MKDKQQVIKKAEWELWHLDCAWEYIKEYVFKDGKPTIYTENHKRLDDAIDYIDKFITEKTEENI
jgi:hypothetical protein